VLFRGLPFERITTNIKFMNTKFYTFIFLITFFTAFTGCKTASKQYDNGNYDEAVDLAVKKLQKKPSDRKAKELLQNAYKLAKDNHESQIKSFSDNTSDLKWEWIYREYTSLQNLYNTIRRSPEAINTVKATDYSGYLSTYAKKSADNRYERGLQLMEKNDKPGFKNAYFEFTAALNFSPDDLNIQSKKDEAYQNALTNVIVMPMDNFRYRNTSYNDPEFRDFEINILKKLQNNSNAGFIKYYSDQEARNRNIPAEQFIDFQFSTQNIGKTKDEETTREVSKEVVVKETVFKPDSIVKEYKKVFAKVTTTKRTISSDGTVLVNVRDINGRRLWTDDVRGNHTWKTEFTTYTGDERALTDADKQAVNKTRENAPEDKAILKYIITDINNNLYSRVRDYFSRQ